MTNNHHGTNGFLGVFVNPYMVQSEGIDRVFGNLDRMGVTAVGLTLQVGRVADEGKGKRIPDLHLDGYRRTLARSAWGRKEFNLESFNVLSRNESWYTECRYRPALREIPEGIDAKIPRTMINEAHRRGMKAYIQMWPTIPPNLREEDQPELPDMSHAQLPHVSLTGSPASPAVREYGKATLRHVLDEYGNADGIIVDWTEFGAYDVRDLFGGCEEFSRPYAELLGIDFDEIRASVRNLWLSLHDLSVEDLQPDRGGLRGLIDEAPGWKEFQMIKSEAVRSLLEELRGIQCQQGHATQEFVARGWPPPWNRMTGLWYERLKGVCSHVAPKLFTFDYCSVPRWYGQVLKEWNPELSESQVLESLVDWLEIPDRIADRRFKDYFVPAVEDPQPAGVPVYAKKISQIAALENGSQNSQPLPIRPFAHAHMPDSMWTEMVEMLRDHEDLDGFWVQMYAYLADSKIEILRQPRLS